MNNSGCIKFHGIKHKWSYKWYYVIYEFISYISKVYYQIWRHMNVFLSKKIL